MQAIKGIQAMGIGALKETHFLLGSALRVSVKLFVMSASHIRSIFLTKQLTMACTIVAIKCVLGFIHNSVSLHQSEHYAFLCVFQTNSGFFYF